MRKAVECRNRCGKQIGVTLVWVRDAGTQAKAACHRRGCSEDGKGVPPVRVLIQPKGVEPDVIRQHRERQYRGGRVARGRSPPFTVVYSQAESQPRHVVKTRSLPGAGQHRDTVDCPRQFA
jgi:hypothetical protein